MHLDDKLSWTLHIQEISRKIASAIGALKCIKQCVPLMTLHCIFNALVQLYFIYCCVVFNHCGTTLTTKLQKLQNRPARVLTWSRYDADADYLIEMLGWKKLANQRNLQTALMVYKSINGHTPQYLTSTFINRDSINFYSLRDSDNKLAVPKPRTNYLKNSFCYSGATLWNSLPIEIRQADSLNSFRTRCSS